MKKLLLVLALLVLLGALGYGGYRAWLFYEEKVALEQEYRSLALSFKQTQEKLASTTAALEAEFARNNAYGAQVEAIGTVVGNLDKLSKTDRELLQKYSKIYFLNENYVPDSLIDIGPEFLTTKNKAMQIHTKVLPYLQKMIETASSSGQIIKVASAYRSFGEQAILKSQYKVTYGSGANTFSADQGYSEHQLGTAVDFSTPRLGPDFSGFGKTDAYKWLLENAHTYGFTLSYPKDNGYYMFEPWHWRFVGVELATRLHDNDKYFYGFSQREINTYLIKIFD